MDLRSEDLAWELAQHMLRAAANARPEIDSDPHDTRAAATPLKRLRKALTRRRFFPAPTVDFTAP